MAEPQPNYWFPAKRHGWGWGLPRAWQGWVVMAVFALAVLSGAWLLLPAGRELAFLAWSLACCVALCLVCRAKGEPPKWRWGER